MDLKPNPDVQEKNAVLQGIKEIVNLINESNIKPFIKDEATRKKYANMVKACESCDLGQEVKGYKIEDAKYAVNFASPLTIGGENRIYAAQDLKTGALLIVRLRIQPLNDEKAKKQFAQSVEILKKLGLFKDYLLIAKEKLKDIPMVFMNLVPGINLETHLDKLPKSPELRAMIARAAFKALVELHKMGIFHGDIKLSNMHLDYKNGELAIRWVDFDHSTLIKNPQPVINYDMLPHEWNAKDPLTHSLEYFRLGKSVVQLLAGKIGESGLACEHQVRSICPDCADAKFKNEFSIVYKNSESTLHGIMCEASRGLCEVKPENRSPYKDTSGRLKQFDKERKKKKLTKDQIRNSF